MLALGSDHGGYDLKNELAQSLRQKNLEFEDIGCFSKESVDYPDIAAIAARGIASGKYEKAVLVCGTGIGMSIAANKFHGIRAALCGDTYSAHMAREHNDANVLCIGARVTGPGLAGDILEAFLKAGFTGGRHSARVDKINAFDDIEKER